MPKHTLVLVFLAISLLSCAPAAWSAAPQGSPAATLTPFGPTGALAAGATASGQTPESVVQAFLTDVQEAPGQIQGYMSSHLRERYPGTAIITELHMEGLMEGFAIRSATSNEVMGLAYVTVGVSTQEESFEVEFTVIKENGNWVISGLEITHPE